MKAIVKEFLADLEPKLCVVSTVGKYKRPEAAVMAYALMDDFTIILSTHDDSRKWNNLKKNPNVALVFGWDHEGLNVQYEGTAKLVEEDEEIENIYFKANPTLGKFRDLPGMGFIRIEPRWIRLTDFDSDRPKVHEVKFDQ